jgi:hypothetical protein
VRSSRIGKTLAHYEVTPKLGKGGMGEVFRKTAPFFPTGPGMPCVRKRARETISVILPNGRNGGVKTRGNSRRRKNTLPCANHTVRWKMIRLLFNIMNLGWT